MRELSVLFRASEDEDQKTQITLLEKAFATRSPKHSSAGSIRCEKTA